MFTVPNGSLIHVPTLTPTKQDYLQIPAATSHRRGRLFYFQGLQGGHAQPIVLSNGPDSTIVNGLTNDGWEIILAPDPADFIDPGPVLFVGAQEQWQNALVNPDMRDDPRKGARFVDTVVRSFDNLYARVNADLGYLPPMVGGGSWGAITSCWLIMARGGKLIDGTSFAGFYAYITPSQLGFIVDLAGLTTFPFDTSGADLATSSDNTPTGTWSSSFLNGCVIPGHVSFGSEDNTVYPYGCDIMVINALAAGAPLAQRLVIDALITGGTSFLSTLFCSGGVPQENGQLITGPGIPAGTTLTSVTDEQNNPAGTLGSGPWTATLSHPCTNTSTIAIASITTDFDHVLWTVTTTGPHGLTTSDTVNFQQIVNSASGIFPSAPNAFNVSNVPVASVIDATHFTVALSTPGFSTNNGAWVGGGPITSYGLCFKKQIFTCPGLGPGYKAPHALGPGQEPALLDWIFSTIDPQYPMVL